MNQMPLAWNIAAISLSVVGFFVIIVLKSLRMSRVYRYVHNNGKELIIYHRGIYWYYKGNKISRDELKNIYMDVFTENEENATRFLSDLDLWLELDSPLFTLSLTDSLPLLILHSIFSGRTNGYEIAQEIKDICGDLDFREGTLYPTLYKLDKEGYVSSRKVEVEGRPRRYYQLTEKGQEILSKWYLTIEY